MTTYGGSRYNVPALGEPPSDGKYRFPVEEDSALIEMLNKIGIYDYNEHDLQRPTQQLVFTCFTAFADLLSYMNEEVMESKKAVYLERLDHKELYDESLYFLIRFTEIRAIMVASCIYDFVIPDITRPKPKRFKKQMFAVLNFVRFADVQIRAFDAMRSEKERVTAERDGLSAKVAKVEEEVEREEEMRRSQEGAMLRLRQINAKLTDRLKVLQEEQQVLTNRYLERRKNHGEAKARCDNLKRDIIGLGNEIEKLQERIEENPTQLKDVIENQKRRLREKEQLCKEEEGKSQMMGQKKRVLEGLETDIGQCTQLVKSCLEEQSRMMREMQDLDKIRSDCNEMVEERDNLALQLDQARQRLKFAIERLDKTQRNIEAKREENKRASEQSNAKWQEAQRERKVRGDRAEEINREVATIEAEYDQITRNFDAFYATLGQRKEELEKHSRGYMQEIAQAMDLQVDVL